MTTTQDAAEISHSSLPSFDRLFVEKLKPNPQNPRRIDDKHPSLVGLAESIKAHDVIEPILVRDLGDAGYMILAGERRWRAARIAGLDKVPCLVRTCDDQTAFEITVTENLQREDLHWLEEARGVELMVKKGWTAEVIASHIGKSPAWVHVRAKLAQISPKWIKEIEDSSTTAARWPIAMVEEICKFPIETQEAMLKEPYSYRIGDAETVAELKQVLAREFLHLLTAAPFPTDDAKLIPKAGACSACPKRSSCQQQLFTEAKADTCLDTACWDEKVDKHRARAIAELKKQEPKAVLAAKDYSVAREVKNCLGGHSFTIAKATDKGAKPAILLADGKEPRLGHIIMGSGRDTSTDTPRGESKPVPMKERLAQFMKRRERASIEAVIVKLGGPEGSNSINHFGELKKASADVTRPPRHALMALVVAFGLRQEHYGSDDAWGDYARVKEMADDNLDQALWERLRIELVSGLIASKCGSDVVTDFAAAVARITGLNWRAIVEGARDSNPLPKSLAEHFDESGAPRKSVGSPAKRSAKARA